MIHIVTAADKKLNLFFNQSYKSISNFYENILIYDLGGLDIGKKIPLDTSYTANQKFPKKPFIILDALENTNEGDFLVWLDCDTILLDKIDPVFSSNFDIGVTIRKSKSKKPQESWINSGVIFLKNNERTTKLVKNWLSVAQKLNGDQYALNDIIKLSKPQPFEQVSINDVYVKLYPCEVYNNFYFNQDQSMAKILHYKTDVRHNYPYK